MAGLNMHSTGHRHPRPGQPGHRAAHPAVLSTGRDPWPAGACRGRDRRTPFGDTLRGLYRQDTPIIALCAAGIVIRSLARCSREGQRAAGAGRGRGRQRRGAVARWPGWGQRDGAGNRRSAGRCRRHHHQRRAAFRHLPAQPAAGLCLADLEQGKRFVSDLLAGESVRIEGDARGCSRRSCPPAKRRSAPSMWGIRCARPTATNC
jgi:cobalt-precorrin 5A hydrolase/precorrin-3B C17-methyltransferase